MARRQDDRMNIHRRRVLAVGAGFICAPLTAVAQQQGKVWRVGFLSLSPRPPTIEADRIGGFPQGMRELGYVEGKNLVIEWRFADGNNERMAAMASELTQMNVDVIVTAGVPPTAAVKKATTTIPIVMGTATDPLGSGLVQSLARPGGNITGLSNIAVDISPKHLEMLIAVAPRLSRVGVLLNPDTSSHTAILKNLNVAAQRVKITIVPVEARTPQEIDNAFPQMVRESATALIVPLAPLFNDQARRIAELALKNRLPSVSAFYKYAEVGGLINYGQNLADHYYRAASYVDKIFRGAKPGDLPIEQPTKFDSVVNRSTAKALGVTIPQELLLRADKLIE